jgi:beta-lactamase regulating signal transducer with metallopeptidase domain
MMMTVFDFHAIAETFALRAVDSLVIGALVAPLAFVLSGISRRAGAAVRFSVWFSALIAIAVVPWVNGLAGLQMAPHGSSATSTAAITAPAPWAVYLFVVWAGIAAIGFLRLSWGLWNLRVLRKSLVPIRLNLLDAGIREKLGHHGRYRSVVVCTSDRVNTPTAVGLVSPAVVIPDWLLKELSEEELHQTLLHELEHLRRWDDWSNLAQKVVKTLFFFHPAVWWIEKKISLEREMACDDAVLAESGSPRAYAACLVHLAEKSMMHQSLVRRGLALAQAAVGRLRQTSLRVAQILNVDRPATRNANAGRKLVVPLTVAFAVVCFTGIARAPRLLAFVEVQPRTLAHSVSPPRFEVKREEVKHEVVPATFRASPPQAKVISRHRVPRIAQAQELARNAGAQAGSWSHGQAPGLATTGAPAVHLAGFRQTAAPAQAVFVVVEQGEYDVSGHDVHRVDVWYILLVNSPANFTQGIPRKQT